MPCLVEIVIRNFLFYFSISISTILLFCYLGKGNRSSFKQTLIRFTEWCFVPSLVDISPVILEKKIFKFRQRLFAISYISPLEKWHGPSFKQIWSLPPNKLCAKFWLKLAHSFWRIKFRQWIFAISYPWKRTGTFISINLNPNHQRMMCAKFGWIWLCGSG